MSSSVDFIASPGPMMILRMFLYKAALSMGSRHSLILELNILKELEWDRGDLFVDREIWEIDKVKVAVDGWSTVLTAKTFLLLQAGAHWSGGRFVAIGWEMVHKNLTRLVAKHITLLHLWLLKLKMKEKRRWFRSEISHAILCKSKLLEPRKNIFNHPSGARNSKFCLALPT